MKLFRIKRSCGFTLIELLVVISIIGIILAFSIFGIQNARKSSRDAARKSDLENIRSALELYKSDCNSYPLTAAFPASGANLTGTQATGSCLTSTVYLAARPEDPTPATKKYSYTSASGSTYTLCASLENNPGGTITCSATSCDSTVDGTGGSCNYQVANP